MRIQKTCGKKIKRFKIGGSLTIEGKYEPVDHSKVTGKPKSWPEGYIGWRKFCSLNGKNPDNADYLAYRKLVEDGKAEVFMGERIVRADAEWPSSPKGKVSARIRNSGY